MPDRMDWLISKAEEDGITARQTKAGTWILERDDQTVAFGPTPETPAEWLGLVAALREMGMKIPGD